MTRWILATLATLGLIGSKTTVTPTSSPTKSANPSATAPTTTPQGPQTDGRPSPP
jgi:hypothetical protein